MSKIQIQAAAIAACLAAISSCIQTEQPSSEADITGFRLPAAEVWENDIDQASGIIYIKVDGKKWDNFTHAAPQITISENATIFPPSGAPVDLTDITLRYVVTAENGRSTKTYTIKVDSASNFDKDTALFSFDEWRIIPTGGYSYYVLDSNDWSHKDWSSGNAGVGIALLLQGKSKNPANYPSQMTTEGKSGCAVKLETKPGATIFGMKIPVWSGNFFLGNFNTNKVTSSPLEATEFGRTYKRKPISLQGYYKYKEGSGKYNDNGTEIDRADSCSIYAVFYRADHDETLTAYDINTSPLTLARAALADGSPTVGDGFHKFNIEFGQYSEAPDFDKHKYKLAIVFSSSARGGTPKYENGQPTKTTIYSGKVGSTLIVDELRVINDW
jgi:hypothetical protein